MKQAVDPYASFRELTLRGMILGALITVIFTASNVYLGLKVGLTFASSIPAAVISMAVLKFFKGSNILENNMVQTQASAAGTLSSIIFILPGLLMAGYWAGFPFWQTTLLCMSGGILGVIFTVPLRYAMVVKSDLPYPEGVAAAEILKVGDHDADQQEGGSGIKELVSGGALAGLMSFCASGLRVVADSASVGVPSADGLFFGLAGRGLSGRPDRRYRDFAGYFDCLGCGRALSVGAYSATCRYGDDSFCDVFVEGKSPFYRRGYDRYRGYLDAADFDETDGRGYAPVFPQFRRRADDRTHGTGFVA